MRSLLFFAAFLSALLPCTSGLLVPLTRASELKNASLYQHLGLQETARDVAVTSIAQVGPPFVNEGDTISINIGVSNNGPEEETFMVTLRDDTAGEPIGSKEVTLAAGGSITSSILWDTDGASGGPAPPGPPTPGTIHALTAIATLTGDTVEGNNSMSLLPGIWVIAAPEAPEITFPEKQKEPEARAINALASEEPHVDTEVAPLAEVYASTIDGTSNFNPSIPAIATAPVSLTNIYKRVVQSDEVLLSDKPEITTIAELVPRITTDELDKKREQDLGLPGIATTGSPLNQVFLYQKGDDTSVSLFSPELEVPSSHQAKIYVESGVARGHLQFAQPGIEAPAATRPVVQVPGQAQAKDNLAEPGMETRKSLLNEVFPLQDRPSLDSAISIPGITTMAIGHEHVTAYVTQSHLAESLVDPRLEYLKSPLRTLFVPLPAANPEGPLAVPVLGTRAAPLETIFGSPVQATLLVEGARPDLEGQFVLEMTETGTIRGRIRLQGRTSSLGSYVETGGQIMFADPQGRFAIERPPGNFDLTVSAPGYLSLTIWDISLETDGVVDIPTVTLPFGDADGDGIINIFDLTVAARNYGQTTSGMWFP